MRILVIQHEAEAPAGVVGEGLDRAGAERITVEPLRGDALPDRPEEFAGLLLLGGPMSVAADDTYPHYRPLFRLVGAFHETGIPVLGICLGAQILARGLGRRVYRHRAIEFGFQPVTVTAAGAADPLFTGRGPDLRPMEWHEDTLDLPDGAVLLATNDFCRNQAYRVGEVSYGVQFHPEVDRRILEDWAASPAAQAASGWSDVKARMQAEMDRHLDQAMSLGRTLAARWMDLVKHRRARRAA
ncbi:MAG: type 1 glutamine amidotransferase [Proteobacteria bacterium]|nr:type 1 glutamine amidotransferase [Pseudomonadota bacterium]MBI3497596.1 type 1 glutamine amidotransferase [Pseudomonadota bacterium]